MRSLSFVAVNVFYPFLAFHTFYENPLTYNHLYIFITFGALILLLFLTILVFSNLSSLHKQRTHAMLLAGLFMNGGNYGVPVVLFTFGQEGFVYALMVMVVMGMLMNSLGLYIAASGANENISKKAAILKTIKMPLLPATLAGMLFQIIGLELPEQVIETIELLSNAAIPLIMIVLGVQLSTIVVRKIEWGYVGFIVFTRLVLSPLLTLIIVNIVGLNSSVLGDVLVLIAAMPSAANTTIFSVRFHVDPNFVSSATFIGTVLSIVTLPIWFAIL